MPALSSYVRTSSTSTRHDACSRQGNRYAARVLIDANVGRRPEIDPGAHLAGDDEQRALGEAITRGVVHDDVAQRHLRGHELRDVLKLLHDEIVLTRGGSAFGKELKSRLGDDRDANVTTSDQTARSATQRDVAESTSMTVQ